MADSTSKPDEQKPASEAPAQASAGRNKYVAWLLAYKWPVLGASAALLVVGVGSYGYLARQKPPDPSVLLARALECLNETDNPDAIPEARKIASELDALRYRDPNFIGAVPYILGITDFRHASQQNDRERLDSYRAAVVHLEQATSVGLDADHRLQTDFALGISKSAIGDAAGAEEPLKRILKMSQGDDVHKAPQEFFDAAAALQESYLDQRGPTHLRKAIALNDIVLKKANLGSKERDQTLLRRAQIDVALHDGEQAEQALAGISAEAKAKPGTILIRAQVDIAAERFQEAQRALEPLAVKPTGLESLYQRQALFLLGVSYEVQKDYENALRKYSDVVRGYAESPEGLAANVRRAELLRKAQRWEEALDAYVKALEMVHPGFSNRWLRLDEFRVLVVAAWDDLKRTRAYEFAIELAKHMRPLFPPEKSYEAVERVATATQALASQLESEIADRPYLVRERRGADLLERWRTSGKACSDLAEALHESPRFADVLWTSAEHYRLGHDFQDALAQMTRFINTQPRQRLPLAYVRRGEILMDLGRFDEALDHFERVLAEYPLDIASFPAMYLVGACEVERNHPDRAIQAWQRVLHDPHLDPSANEWQASLFALGRLQYQVALTMPAPPNAVSAQNENPGETRPRPLAAYGCLDEAIRRLEEFVARYPKRPESPESRYLLAKALRDRATLPRYQLKRAETDNARKELKAKIQTLLSDAENQLEALIDALQTRDMAGLLEPFEQRMVRDAYFERGHNLYALQKYDRAIEAYTSAANRYAEDPSVLLAYIQMANCYDRLGKSIDARGVAIQAMLIHKNMSEKAFTRDKTLMTRDEWRTWLEWAGALREGPRRSEPAAATASNAAPASVSGGESPNTGRDPLIPKSS